MPHIILIRDLLCIAAIPFFLYALYSCNDTRGSSDDYATTFSRLKSSAMDSTTISDWFYRSDSVRNMIEYYSTSRSPEASAALMYMAIDCEKVGDAPAAIIFYDRATTALHDGDTDTYESTIMRKLAYLHWRLSNRGKAIRLYKQAAALDTKTNDSVHLAEEYHSLSNIYRELGFLDKAHAFHTKSTAYTDALDEEDKAIVRLNGLLIDALSGNEMNRHVIEQTLAILNRSDSRHIRAAAAVNGSLIYKAANDDASMSLWQSRAYEEMPLPDDMSAYTPTLSAQRYALGANKSADIQTALYNYQLHELQAQRLRGSVRQMLIWGLCGILLLLIGVIALLIKLNIKNHTCIRLQQLIADMERIGGETTGHDKTPTPDYDATDPESLRKALKTRMLRLLENDKDDRPPISLPEHIISEINELLANNSPCTESSPLWHDIEDAVLAQSPDFSRNLRLLIGRQVKPDEYRMMLLIKAGYRPSHLTCLVSRTKGTISNRRRMLCVSIFGENLGNDKFDKIIQLL